MRCVACDAPLSVSESPWRADLGRFEDMCRRCRSTIMDEREPTARELLQVDDDLTEVPE